MLGKEFFQTVLCLLKLLTKFDNIFSIIKIVCTSLSKYFFHIWIYFVTDKLDVVNLVHLWKMFLNDLLRR